MTDLQSVPWHPFFVHFPMALWPCGTLVLIAAFLAKRQEWQVIAWTMLSLGTLGVIPTVLSGQHDIQPLLDSNNLLLLRHRDLGNMLPWLMGALLLAKAHVSFSKKAPVIPVWIWCFFSLAISLLLLYSGYLGGQLVYRHGLGTSF